MSETESRRVIDNSGTKPDTFTSLALFRDRALRVVTSIPEIAYALGRHWLITLVSITIAAFFALMSVHSKPLVYLGQVKLKVNESDSFLSTRTPYRKGQTERFLNSQTSLLTSDSVLRRLAHRVGLDTPRAKKDPDDSPIATLRKNISETKALILEVLEIQDATTEGVNTEKNIQRAVRELRDRSTVSANSPSGTIRLQILGTSRTQIHRELEGWVESYMAYVEELDRESRDVFFKNRVEDYQKMEEEAFATLTKFKDENSETSEGELEFLDQQIAQIQIIRQDLERPRNSNLFDLLAPRREDPKLAELRLAKAAIFRELIDKEAEGYTEKSPQVQKIRRKMARIDSMIEKHTSGLTDTPDDVAAATREEKRNKRIEILTTELKQKLVKRSTLRERIRTRQRLEEKLRSIQNSRERFSNMSHDNIDMLEFWKTVKVQVYDRPSVSVTPHKYRPLLVISTASLGGLGIGLVLSLVLEILCSRVRFKRDIIGDFGIPVIGVVPRK